MKIDSRDPNEFNLQYTLLLLILNNTTNKTNNAIEFTIHFATINT